MNYIEQIKIGSVLSSEFFPEPLKVHGKTDLKNSVHLFFRKKTHEKTHAYISFDEPLSVCYCKGK